MKLKINLLTLLSLAGSAQAISFRDYYYGNTALDIPSHFEDVDHAIGSGQLDLSNKNLTDLTDFDADHLIGLSDLEVLNLAGNKLTELPANFFQDFDSLVELNLNNNRLTTLPATIFLRIGKTLRELYLANNRITVLHAPTFSNLHILSDLDLSGNDLKTLPLGIFLSLQALRYLSLNYNQLAELPRGVFKGLDKLKNLYLQWNQLSMLPAGIFNNLSNITILNLAGNEIAKFPPSIFADLETLRILDLYNNPIPLNDDELRKELGIRPFIRLYFKGREQRLIEQQMFTAIRNGDYDLVRQLYKTIMLGRVGIPVGSEMKKIDIAKMRDVDDNNLLQTVVQSLAQKIREINREVAKSIAQLTPEEKKAVEDQTKSVEEVYIKILGTLIQFGGPSVEEMLSVRNKNGDDVLGAAIGALGRDSSFVRALINYEQPRMRLPAPRLILVTQRPHSEKTEKNEAETASENLAVQRNRLQKRPLELPGPEPKRMQFERIPAIAMEEAPEALEAKQRSEQKQGEEVAQQKRTRALGVLGLTSEQDNSQLIAARFRKLSDEYSQIISSSAPANEKNEAECKLHELYSAWTYLAFGR